MKKTKDQRRTCFVKIRFSPDEMLRVRTLMDSYGYRTVSSFFRDLVVRKRFSDKRAEPYIDDKVLREKMNLLIYQVNKIGVNYNQVAATWQKQARQVRPDGSPYMNTRSVEGKLTELMRLTEGLRDEFAVSIDYIKRYLSPEETIINP